MTDTLAGDTTSFSPVISVSGTFGAVFIGSFISLSLYGLFVHQAFKYFSLYRSDALWVKGLVILASIFETAVSVFHIHLTYFYFVEIFGNTLAFLDVVWSINITSIISVRSPKPQTITLPSLMLDSTYVGPKKYKHLPVVVSALLMAGAMGISIGEQSSRPSTTPTPQRLIIANIGKAITVIGFRGLATDNFQTLLNLTLAYNAVASGADVILTVTVIYMLHKCRTGLKRTDGIINRLIMYTISTVYSNALMAALNSRKVTVGHPTKNGRPSRTDAYGTTHRGSTVRFAHGPVSASSESAIDDSVELLQWTQTSAKSASLEGGSGSTLGPSFKKDVLYDG
ncbi:hypothetical protein GSI_05594 [Ganoderma sinense ZZ0214-1]|uniref:Uncharacterized protein n=1 Tax=Ganoderma sinense ZZ0214-1 TaxID=1077348 RepID=A0A2G8SFH7_9APHY|nr:hypothetical protein GSI_05594 [Ganoderma sinense ZZ0214-1]